MKIQVKLYDFNIEDIEKEEEEIDEEDDEKKPEFGCNKLFRIQMFGMDERGNDYSIISDDFKPFFYIKIPDDWTIPIKNTFVLYLKESLGKYYRKALLEDQCKLRKKKDLYGFDNDKEYKFIVVRFNCLKAFNKAKNLWYSPYDSNKKRTLLKKGFRFKYQERWYSTYLYEAKLPPLLRMFHIKEISPSGWITVNKEVYSKRIKKSRCKYEFDVSYRDIVPLNEKETLVPMKIMSWDIEASSSHGDFPLAKKHYRKLIQEIIEYWIKNKEKLKKKNLEERTNMFRRMMLKAYGFEVKCDANISKIHTNSKLKGRGIVEDCIQKIISYKIGRLIAKAKKPSKWERMKSGAWEGTEMSIEEIQAEDDEEDSYMPKEQWIPSNIPKDIFNNNIIYCLDSNLDAGKKVVLLDRALEWRSKKMDEEGWPIRDHAVTCPLPKIAGDKVTFIGSTFMKVGEDEERYLNHMVVLNSCNEIPEVPNSQIETYETEKELLVGWAKMIKRENPEVVIGYNTFGFDWKFMIARCEELGIKSKFLKLLSKNNEGATIAKSVTKVASGTYDLKYVKMNGRLQVDLFCHFKKSVNLPSYKLDAVASFYIGDKINKVEYEENELVKIYSDNLMGLRDGHYIKFEIINHSTDVYKEGKKFIIRDLCLEEKSFKIQGEFKPGNGKLRWCLAKDDVTPHDIFRLSLEGPEGRAKVAKYCYQDCNLVHNLFLKNKIFTGYCEMSKICSVPIDFIAMRGQGIKLLSYIAKKCREKKTLMPVKEKGNLEEGYEGAIVLPPKNGFYVDNPVAVNDYSSLYPSSMISENISHDSKVWTKEYDLEGKLLKTTGERDLSGNFIYDDLQNFKYVDVEYDLYEYRRKNPKAKAEKVKVGKKKCRFAQYPNNRKAIMPSVLQELLAARKVYKKMKKQATTPFLTDLYDQRQLAVKVVANSLYGQCGAKTSSFYEIDIAASTTATGRKLLMYARAIVEGCYKNRVCDTKNHGKVKTDAEYIYGDTDSVFFSFNLKDMDGIPIKGKKALEITIELAVEAGELATMWLKDPHDLEYEKTFDPFLLLSKKRYVGMLHEFDVNKGKRKEMGIVLKRRDNANCVKDIYGGVVDILMKTHDVNKAVTFSKKYLNDMINEKIGMDKLIITKKLNSFYKNPESIAHKVLADRMAKRDPGNKPAVGSRMPFVYIQTKGKVKLQGDKIESPDYIKTKNLKPDYNFYITNQIMKPLLQLFGLVLEQLPEFKPKLRDFKRKVRGLNRQCKEGQLTEEKLQQKITKIRNKNVKELIFDPSLNKQKSDAMKKAMREFFTKR
jgi:DNA polymerase elongation subunit (family B)